jgi:hypothetical protein
MGEFQSLCDFVILFVDRMVYANLEYCHETQTRQKSYENLISPNHQNLIYLAINHFSQEFHQTWRFWRFRDTYCFALPKSPLKM